MIQSLRRRGSGRLRIRWAAIAICVLAILPLRAQVWPGFGKGAGPRLGTISQIEVAVADREQVRTLVDAGCDVDGAFDQRVRLYVDEEELAALHAAGWAPRVLPAVPFERGDAKAVLGRYHTFTELTSLLDTYATANPALCRKVSLGKSVQGRDLWAVKVSHQVDVPADKARVRFVSTIHGDEPVGTEMCLYFLDYLLNGDRIHDPRVVQLLDTAEIWLVPVVNPDGYAQSFPQRYNANGYDLNRSFPDGAQVNFGNRLFGPDAVLTGLEPEVRAMMEWTLDNSFTLGAEYHTGALLVNYPYDNDGLGSAFSPTPDEAVFKSISQIYAVNNPPMWANNSPPFVNGVVNGALWYSIEGGMEDWTYRYDGGFDVIIELSNIKTPPANQLLTFWTQNLPAMMAYAESALTGLRGVVSDAQTGLPVRAAVRVEGFHHLVFSGVDVGDYHRLLNPGAYNVWFYAPGYVTQRRASVVIQSGAATRVDVALEPEPERFALKVDFQPAAAAVPPGYAKDSGAIFGIRSNGKSYGWNTALSASAMVERAAGRSQDSRYDTTCLLPDNGSRAWSVAVPNGPHQVLLCAGDALTTSGQYRFNVQGQLLLAVTPNANQRWFESLGRVIVTSGTLTLSNGTGTVGNRLAFLEIAAVDPLNLAEWRAMNFGTTNNTGAAANTADPDDDGLANLQEYAFGLDPNRANAGVPFQLSTTTQANELWLVGSFFRNTNATDLRLSVHASDSLRPAIWNDVASWLPGQGWTAPGQLQEIPAADGLVKVTVRDVQSLTGKRERYLRLRVSAP